MEIVLSDGVASNTVLSNTGQLLVAGGEADGTIVRNNPLGNGGGLVLLSGTANGTIVSSGGARRYGAALRAVRRSRRAAFSSSPEASTAPR